MKWSIVRAGSIHSVLLAMVSSGCLGLLVGCDELLPGQTPSDEDEDQGSGAFDYDAEPGTCDGWKVRYCEAFVLCGDVTLEECVYEAEFVACHADSPYSKCEQKFEEVIAKDDCSLFPRDCYPRDIADRTAPYEVCRNVQAAVCEFDFYCGSPYDTESCIAATNQTFECDARLSIGTGVESCLTEVERAFCGDALPESCLDHTRL